MGVSSKEHNLLIGLYRTYVRSWLPPAGPQGVFASPDAACSLTWANSVPG